MIIYLPADYFPGILGLYLHCTDAIAVFLTLAPLSGWIIKPGAPFADWKGYKYQTAVYPWLGSYLVSFKTSLHSGVLFCKFSQCAMG
jgi:hypothetical protein